ncbi:hypothetical protein AMJ85_11610 [candidate division BRC1 bacterium SM23_51]|nr:MAG: hypothetical protein AMJ85_11610 [candidate division BRC1 bacterium SM23_51]
MADLFDRLFPSGEEPSDKIPVHAFRAAMGDYAAGYTTRSEIISYWSLDSEAQTDLDVLLAEINASTPLEKAFFLLQLHDVMMIAEQGAKYTTKAAFRDRLGL